MSDLGESESNPVSIRDKTTITSGEGLPFLPYKIVNNRKNKYEY